MHPPNVKCTRLKESTLSVASTDNIKTIYIYIFFNFTKQPACKFLQHSTRSDSPPPIVFIMTLTALKVILQQGIWKFVDKWLDCRGVSLARPWNTAKYGKDGRRWDHSLAGQLRGSLSSPSDIWFQSRCSKFQKQAKGLHIYESTNY